ILVAKLGDVHPERSEKVQRVARRQVAFGESATQIDCLSLAIPVSNEFRFEQVEIRELLLGGKRRVIGDIVRSPHKIVEGKNYGPVAGVNEPRGHRKILVAVALAGSQFGSAGHRELVNCMCFKRVPHIGEYALKTNAAPGSRRRGDGTYCPWIFRTW